MMGIACLIATLRAVYLASIIAVIHWALRQTIFEVVAQILRKSEIFYFIDASHHTFPCCRDCISHNDGRYFFS
jgi:Na+/serine symporter